MQHKSVPRTRLTLGPDFPCDMLRLGPFMPRYASLCPNNCLALFNVPLSAASILSLRPPSYFFTANLPRIDSSSFFDNFDLESCRTISSDWRSATDFDPPWICLASPQLPGHSALPKYATTDSCLLPYPSRPATATLQSCCSGASMFPGMCVLQAVETYPGILRPYEEALRSEERVAAIQDLRRQFLRHTYGQQVHPGVGGSICATWKSRHEGRSTCQGRTTA